MLAELNTEYNWYKLAMMLKTWLLVLHKSKYMLSAEELSWRWHDTGENLIDCSGDLQLEEFKI